MKYTGYIIIYALIILWLTGCSVKDYNLNPWTTALNQLVKVSYEVEQKVCLPDVNSCVD